MILSDMIWRVRCDKCYKLAEAMWSSKYKAEEDMDYVVDAYQWEIAGSRHLCEKCKEIQAMECDCGSDYHFDDCKNGTVNQ